jgi:hypothetical protein
MHSYQRRDSVWAQQYSTPLADYAKGWDSQSSEILPAFIRYDCMNDTWEPINPAETASIIHDPKEFGDNWEEPLERADVITATQYFRSIFHLTKTLDFINLRVGSKDNTIDLSHRKFNRGITFEAPRHSLMLAIQHEIFDDMLIGNFMKTTLHGKLIPKSPAVYPSLYPYFAPYVPKYADNGRAKSKEELIQYFKEYKRRREQDGIYGRFLLHRLEEVSKNVFRSYIAQHSIIYQTSKRLYYAVKKRF